MNTFQTNALIFHPFIYVLTFFFSPEAQDAIDQAARNSGDSLFSSNDDSEKTIDNSQPQHEDLILDNQNMIILDSPENLQINPEEGTSTPISEPSTAIVVHQVFNFSNDFYHVFAFIN